MYRFYADKSNYIICYYVKTNTESVLVPDQLLTSLLQLFPSQEMQLKICDQHNQQFYQEIGPRLGWTSPWGAMAKTILHRCGYSQIVSIEHSKLYLKGQFPLNYDQMTEMIYPEPLDILIGQKLTLDDSTARITTIPLAQLSEYNDRYQLGLDEFDLDFCRTIFEREGRDPTQAEISDLAQCNSEHSRHWLFRGLITTGDDYYLSESLFDWIKKPLKHNPRNSLVAMKDNSSAIRSPSPITTLANQTVIVEPNILYPLFTEKKLVHPIFTAETHNFPTGIAPFSGATTGTGGRIRDIQGMGRGGQMIAGTAGYSVGDIRTFKEGNVKDYPLHHPKEILLKASDGASDYGNKIGEPIIQGFCRSFGQMVDHRRIEWVKPIMFTGGVGQIWDEHVYKQPAQPGLLIVRLGGPTYRIGLGGGSASSQSQKTVGSFQQAVQRGDAEMENRLHKVIRACCELGSDNPILSIHDQGAGGMANVTQEIVSEGFTTHPVTGRRTCCGGLVSLGNINLGDPSLTPMETWIAESQEQDTVLIHPKDINLMKQICARENCPIEFFGVVTDTGRIQVYDPESCSFPVDLDLNMILAQIPRKTFKARRKATPTPTPNRTPLSSPKPSPKRQRKTESPFSSGSSNSNYINNQNLNLQSMQLQNMNVTIKQLPTLISQVLTHPSVGSKRFLTNKVDRSVTGLVAQQQCVGPLQTPLANVAVVAQSHYTHQGIATAIGEQPIKGLLDPYKMARLTTGELLTNLVWSRVTDFEDIKCSGNWMWEKKDPEEVWALYEAVRGLSEVCCQLGIAIDGGKDSLSMSAQVGQTRVLSPRTLVLSGYVTCPDIRQTVTPDLKPQLIRSHDANVLTSSSSTSSLYFIDLGINDIYRRPIHSFMRLGGSILSQIMNKTTEFPCPDLEDSVVLKRTFETVQTLIKEEFILAGHDRSDGGLITCLLEMALASSECGFNLTLPKNLAESDLIPYLFNEELGLVIQVDNDRADAFIEIMNEQHLPWILLGQVITRHRLDLEPKVTIRWRDQVLLDEKVSYYRMLWEDTSLSLEKDQCLVSCVNQEKEYLRQGQGLTNSHFWTPRLMQLMVGYSKPETDSVHYYDRIPIAILREEGSNGDREMAAAFEQVGFQPFDVTMTDLLTKQVTLDQFQGVVFVGGFSFADVLEAGRGWASVIKSHPELKIQFENFRQNPETFSLGICNGAQLMTELGWVPGKLVANQSGRFESRYVTVKIPKDHPAMMLKGFDESCLGVWIAHAEGRWQSDSTQPISSQMQVLHYVDNQRQPTNHYPENPNGSPGGLAGVCSADGRHLAMMPHPERCVQNWQCPWIAPKHQVYSKEINASPWMVMFENAYKWCLETRYK